MAERGERSSLAVMDADPPTRSGSRSPLDGAAARLSALGVILLVLAALAWIHWERIFPPAAQPLAADDPAALCYVERAADIEAMEAEGSISAEQAALFKSRAEAFCRAQAGQTSAPPSLPGQ